MDGEGGPGQQFLLHLGDAQLFLAGGAVGQMVAEGLRLLIVEQAVKKIPELFVQMRASHDVVWERDNQTRLGVSTFNTRRSFCKAERIWVFTVPTGNRRASAISS